MTATPMTTDKQTAGRVPIAPGQDRSLTVTDNVIDFPTRQTDGTPIPILLGGGLLRCGRCTRTFTAETWHCIENLNEDATGLLNYTDVCRRCAYHDPDLTHWQNLCDVYDSIDQVMQDAKDQGARDLLKHLITSSVDHFSVWRWPEDQPDPSTLPDDEDDDL